ncbi:MAG: glycosyltransferase [Phycisphaerales bacterium]|nr:glycosyltransferase [Phycisphaerales bacterium]
MNVCVVMPVYNAAAAVGCAIRSALAETRVSAVIVIDDGSTDGSADAARSVADARILIESQRNAGPGAARNRGIDLALTQREMTHLLFLDADDQWLPGSLDAVAAVLRDRPQTGLIVGGRVEADGGEERRTIPPPDWADRVLAVRGGIFRPQPFFGTSGMIVARRIVERGVRFDPRLRIGEDRDFAYRAANLAPVFITSRLLLRVALHRGGDNLTGPAQLHRWLEDHLRLIEWHGQDQGAAEALHEQADWLLAHASRMLARRGERIEAQVWRAYMDRYRAMGWPRPWRALRWRWLLAPAMRPFVRR